MNSEVKIHFTNDDGQPVYVSVEVMRVYRTYFEPQHKWKSKVGWLFGVTLVIFLMVVSAILLGGVR